MLTRFLEVEEALRAYYRNKNEKFPLSNSEVEGIRSILPALQIVAEASTRLQKDGSTFFDAELILQVCLSHCTCIERLCSMTRTVATQRCFFQYCFTRLGVLSSTSPHSLVLNLIACLEAHVAKRRSVASRCAIYIELREQKTFLDYRLEHLAPRQVGSIRE